MSVEKSLVATSTVFAVLWISGMALLTAFTSNGSVSAGSAISVAIGGTVAGLIWYWLTRRRHNSVS